jgi:glycosyltransferase involved in cell wall biosynthesis
MGLEDMFNFVPSQPAFRIPEIFADCDAALISLRKNPIFEKTIPAKTQSCLACGIPILISADGEASRIIEEAKAGYSSPAEDWKGLHENIIKMIKLSEKARKEIGLNGYEYFQTHFKKSKVMNRMDNILNELEVENIPT